MKEATLDISLHLAAAAGNPHEAADAKSKRQRKRVKSYLNRSANFRNGGSGIQRGLPCTQSD